MIVTSYRKRMRLLGLLAFGGALVAGLIAGQIVRASDAGAQFWVVFPALLAVCAAAFAATLPWWRRMDDVQRSGHLVSWYWGSSLGFAVTIMALIAATGLDSDVSRGAQLLVLGQTVGFLACYAGWWLKGRGAAE